MPHYHVPSNDEYFIEFDCDIDPGKVQAVRVQIDLVTFADMKARIRVDLCEHPLYKELQQYVKDNPRP